MRARTRQMDLDRAEHSSWRGAEDEDAITEVDGLVDVVRHVDDGHAAFLAPAVHAQDDVLELLTGKRIDRGERLVEQ